MRYRDTMPPKRPSLRDGPLLLALLLLLALVVVRNAWVSDDAFITLRTVHNALDGYGLRFNIAERVQAYTHPLWMGLLLLGHGISGEPYYSTLSLGLFTTLVGISWLSLTARSRSSALLAVGLLISSKAYIDFSTSGLENPLTHLLWLGMLASVERGGGRPKDLLRTTLLFSFALLNRLDALLLVGPLLLFHISRTGRSVRHLLAFGTGLLPILFWETFSLIYYGALLPNTAPAKLGAEIPRLEQLAQGLRYARQPFRFDPITGLALLCIAPLALFHRGVVGVALGGATLHGLYVVWVGGDFMAGRFWTPVVFAVALALSRLDLRPRTALLLTTVLLGLGASSPNAPIRSGAHYQKHAPWSGIVDERGFYFDGAALLGPRPISDHPYARAGRRARASGEALVTRATLGYFGYFAGPDVHVLDPLGLSEPLLARLPARYDPNWRVGHYRRAEVAGYNPRTGHPPDDPALRLLHQRLQRLSQGPLLDPARWLDGLRLFVSPPTGLDHRRFIGALPLHRGTPIALRRRGVRLELDPASPEPIAMSGPPEERLYAVFLRHSEVILATKVKLDPDGTLVLPSPLSPADALLLYPPTRDAHPRITVD